MSLRRRSTFKPSLESLEDRMVPAGVLTTSLVNGTLTVTGTDNNEQIAVLGGANGHVSLSALDGETFNGRNSFTRVRRLVLDMRAGNDQVTLVDLIINRSNNVVNVLGGNGDDSVFYDGTNIDIAGLRINSGSGAFFFGPTAPVKAQFFSIDIDATASSGSTMILGGSVVASTTRVQGSQTGSDLFLMDDNTFMGAFTFNSFGGNDTVIMGHLDQNDGEELIFGAAATFSLGSGDDSMTAGINVHQPGMDDLTPDFTRFRGITTLDGGSGNDTMRMHHPRSIEYRFNDNPTINNTETIIYANTAPTFVTADTFNVPENTTAVAQVAADDPDVDTVTFSIVGGADATAFAIDAQGNLSFVTPPNFENPTDANFDNVYQVQVRASDGQGGLTTQLINVTVTDVNDRPVIVTTGTVNVQENNTAVLTVRATDQDEAPPDTLNFSIIGGNDASRFMISASGILSFLVAPDFETPTDSNLDNVYLVRVQVSDGQGGFANQLISVTVTDDPGN